MELKDQVEGLQKDIAQLTQVMTEKAQKDLTGEVKELSDKLVEVQKELQERKIQFAAASAPASQVAQKDLETRMDELFIAKHLCVNKDTGTFEAAKYAKICEAKEYADAIKAFGDVNAVGTSTQTGVTSLNTAGAFVPAGFSSQLMEEIWLNLEIAGLFGRIQAPAAVYNFPFNPGRIIAQASFEGNAVTKSTTTDAKITFTAQKIMSIVELTDELEQDAIFPVLNLLRKQLIEGFALAQDAMALNGDKGTVCYSSALGATDARKLVNGIRTSAMSTGTKLDASTGGCSAANIRKVRALMGKYGKAPSDLAIICSIADYNNLLTESAYQTLYSYGPGAVILNGELGRIDNIPVIVSELIPQIGATDSPSTGVAGGLNASGVYDATTKTKGTFALVNKNGFMWGDRKEFSLELFRNPFNQTTNLIGAQRLDFEKVLSATSTPVGVGYNY